MYKTPYDFKYKMKELMPMLAMGFVIMFMFLGLYGSQLQASGETTFKECRGCGNLNYQFVTNCSSCGHDVFEDTWFRDDIEKKDKKHKKKSKNLLDIYASQYTIFITPLDHLIAVLEDEQVCMYEGYSLHSTIQKLYEIRTELMQKYELSELR